MKKIIVFLHALVPPLRKRFLHHYLLTKQLS